MSVMNTDKIDSMGVDKDGKRVFLSIIDALQWDGDNVHLFALAREDKYVSVFY